MQRMVVYRQGDIDVGCLRVAGDIRQGFLGNPIGGGGLVTLTTFPWLSAIAFTRYGLTALPPLASMQKARMV